MAARALRCRDCGVDTAPIAGNAHYYWLRPELWRRVTRHDRARFLCLACLARRLRRPLRAYEFGSTPAEVIARIILRHGCYDRAQRRLLLRLATGPRPLGERQRDLARCGHHFICIASIRTMHALHKSDRWTHANLQSRANEPK
jgi:hypothetical protein